MGEGEVEPSENAFATPKQRAVASVPRRGRLQSSELDRAHREELATLRMRARLSWQLPFATVGFAIVCHLIDWLLHSSTGMVSSAAVFVGIVVGLIFAFMTMGKGKGRTGIAGHAIAGLIVNLSLLALMAVGIILLVLAMQELPLE